MAPPDPVFAYFFFLCDKAYRLRVMDEDDVPVERRVGKHELRMVTEDLVVVVGDVLRLSVKCVMEFLRDSIEVYPAFDDIPPGVETCLFEEGYHADEYLCDPSADSRRIDVLN